MNVALATGLFTSMTNVYAGGEEGVIEEIVVTATKRTESIQDIPASDSAFSASGIYWTIVNGEPTLNGMDPTGAYSGRVLSNGGA